LIVAYDLRYATDHFPGIGTHAFALLNALLERPGDERYRVLWNPAEPSSRFDLAALRAHPRVEWRECDAPSLGWDTPRRTGAALRAAGGDVLFSPFSLMPDSPGMPAVLTLHDVLPLAPESRTPWWRRIVFAQAMRSTARASVVLTSSEFSRGEIARRTAIPAARVRVVRLGVLPPPAVELVPPPGCPAGPFALTVGINKPHKNLAVLAQAWRSFAGGPPLALVAVGPTDPRFPGWEQLAAGARGVVPLGRVTQPALEWLYRNATLVLHPSRYEGFGLPVLEAASRGAPVVCADVPALRELGEGAVRFAPPGDAAAWATAVSELAADAPARSRMREAGLKLAAAHDYARCAAETLAILREVGRRRG
jgi:alpha-1,3-rhamnosyl/mannosyltransferase